MHEQYNALSETEEDPIRAALLLDKIRLLIPQVLWEQTWKETYIQQISHIDPAQKKFYFLCREALELSLKNPGSALMKLREIDAQLKEKQPNKPPPLWTDLLRPINDRLRDSGDPLQPQDLF